MTALWWQLLSAVNVAVMIRAYRPRFCKLLWAEFGPKNSRALRELPFTSARDSSGNQTAPACRRALLDAPLPPSVPRSPRSVGRTAPNVNT